MSDIPFKKQILTRPFMFLVAFSSLHSLRLNYCVATIYDQLLKAYDGDADIASDWNTVFSTILPFGFVLVPLTGWWLDTKGSHASFWLANVLACIYGVSWFFLTEPFFFVVAACLVACSRQIVFGTSFTSVTLWFGNATFGRMIAVKNIFVAAIGLTLYPITNLSLFLEGYDVANVIMLCLTIPLFFGKQLGQYTEYDKPFLAANRERLASMEDPPKTETF
jgi:hypothetical protein